MATFLRWFGGILTLLGVLNLSAIGLSAAAAVGLAVNLGAFIGPGVICMGLAAVLDGQRAHDEQLARLMKDATATPAASDT